jgi:glycolate oxidase iron-sulfur subunit
MPLLRLYQKLGLQRLHLTRFLPGYLGDWERLLPLIPEKSVHHTLGEILPAQPPMRGRVGLLTGCLENALLANMGLATARVLAHNGFEVVIPQDQVCCGALPGHIGELDIAREQARKNLDVFTTAEVDFVVSDAAGCSAQLKEYAHLLKDDVGYAHKAQEFISKTRDATELLADYLPLRKDMNRLNLRVAYDDPCHLIHSQGISRQPRELLRSIPGLELIELPEASWCCGSAGTYNLTHVFESHKLLERKIAHVQKLNVNTLATANTGCYLQLAKGVHDMGVNIEVIHVVELLARAYGLV